MRHRRAGWRGDPAGDLRRRLAAAAVALLGVLLIVAGVVLVSRPPAVDASPFRAAAATEQPKAVPPAHLTSSATPEPGEAAAADKLDPQSLAPGSLGEVAAADAVTAVAPRSIAFPAAHVVADVVPVGVLDSGALQLPADPARVGWWAAGAMPGEDSGTVVVAGHMDGLRQTGAMRALLTAAPGDVVHVDDDRGATHAYRIVERAAAPASRLDPALFATEGPHRLVLITCGGEYSEAAGGYLENIVVTAEPVAWVGCAGAC